MSEDRHSGKVKWYNVIKGYGFVIPNDGGRDIFLHASALERAGLKTLREGQSITYILRIDEAKGRTSAVDIQTVR